MIPKVQLMHWHQDSNAFMALIRVDPPGPYKYQWQNYVRTDHAFEEKGPAKEVMGGIVNHDFPGDLVVINTGNIHVPIRRHLLSNYWTWVSQLVDKLWPERALFLMYQSTTGELVKSWELPGVEWKKGMFMRSYPEPDGQGLILLDPQSYTLAYWDFNPASRWYSRLGLALGIVFAILLAWSNLRRSGLQRGGNAVHA